MKTAFSDGGRAPLPILNHINNGYLPLINYNINEANINSFGQILHTIIPSLLRKLYFVNNSLTEKHITILIKAIS